MQIEILAALVQVTQASEERKAPHEKCSPLYTEDFNASQKIMDSVEDDHEKLSDGSESYDDAHHEEETKRH